MKEEMENVNTETALESCPAEGEAEKEESGTGTGNSGEKKRRFGRGIYDSKDVPIRWLDRLIIVIIAVIAVMVIVFAINGGYTISFDTKGGTEVAAQKLRYGNFVTEPEVPVRPGYTFGGWYYEQNPDINWDFATNKVGGDMTLIAIWNPAEITVKFDPDGGSLKEQADSIKVTWQDKYGELPVPEKEGKTFAGWEYSGEIITADSTVAMPGEHVLTATWN